MKHTTLLTTIISIAALASCTTTKQTTNEAVEQAKSNIDIGYHMGRVDGGYEVGGHASTNIFGLEPYGSFTTGMRYNPKPVTPEPIVVTAPEVELESAVVQ